MSNFVIATFSSEAKAYEGLSTLASLHDEGSITLYGTVVVQRDADGKLVTKQATDDTDVASVGLGTLLGGLIGALGGPVGAAVGVIAGSAGGGLSGFVHDQVSDEFLEDVTQQLKPGMFAVLAEVTEQWTAPIDTRIEALGGTIVRENRDDVFDDILEKRTEARRAYLDGKKKEIKSKKAEKMAGKIDQEIADARDKLQRVAEKARQRLDDTKGEMDGKLKKLEAQASSAKPEVKKQINERIADIRREYEERAKKLSHAYDLAQEALQ